MKEQEEEDPPLPETPQRIPKRDIQHAGHRVAGHWTLIRPAQALEAESGEDVCEIFTRFCTELRPAGSFVRLKGQLLWRPTPESPLGLACYPARKEVFVALDYDKVELPEGPFAPPEGPAGLPWDLLHPELPLPLKIHTMQEVLSRLLRGSSPSRLLLSPKARTSYFLRRFLGDLAASGQSRSSGGGDVECLGLLPPFFMSGSGAGILWDEAELTEHLESAEHGRFRAQMQEAVDFLQDLRHDQQKVDIVDPQAEQDAVKLLEQLYQDIPMANGSVWQLDHLSATGQPHPEAHWRATGAPPPSLREVETGIYHGQTRGKGLWAVPEDAKTGSTAPVRRILSRRGLKKLVDEAVRFKTDGRENWAAVLDCPKLLPEGWTMDWEPEKNYPFYAPPDENLPSQWTPPQMVPVGMGFADFEVIHRTMEARWFPSREDDCACGGRCSGKAELAAAHQKLRKWCRRFAYPKGEEALADLASLCHGNHEDWYVQESGCYDCRFSDREELYEIIVEFYKLKEPLVMLSRQAPVYPLFFDLDIWGGRTRGETTAHSLVWRREGRVLLGAVTRSLFRLLPGDESIIEVVVYCSSGFDEEKGREKASFHLVFPMLLVRRPVMCLEGSSKAKPEPGSHVLVRDHVVCCLQDEEQEDFELRHLGDTLRELAASVPEVLTKCNVCKGTVRELSEAEARGKTCGYAECREAVHFGCSKTACNEFLCEKHSKESFTNEWSEVFDENPMWHDTMPGNRTGLRLPFTDKSVELHSGTDTPKRVLAGRVKKTVGRWQFHSNGDISRLPDYGRLEDWVRIGDISREKAEKVDPRAKLLDSMDLLHDEVKLTKCTTCQEAVEKLSAEASRGKRCSVAGCSEAAQFGCSNWQCARNPQYACKEHSKVTWTTWGTCPCLRCRRKR